MKKILLIFLLFLSYNAYSQWAQYPSGSFGGSLNFVQFDNNVRGYFGGNCSFGGPNIIFRTYDGGAYGNVISTGTTNTYYDFCDAGSGILYLTGSQKCILKNSGSFWQTIFTGTGNYYSISVLAPNTIYVVGDSPDNINKSTNGGNNWTALVSPTNNTLKGVFFVDVLTGLICGQTGTLFRTTDGGATWTRQSKSTSINFEKMYFINSSTGIVVGSGGSVQKTTDGGTTWIPKQSNVNTNLNSICFYPPDLFWAAGDNGKIIKSSNAGESWVVQNTNNSAVTFNDIFASSVDTAYAVTSQSVMYKTTNSGGLTFIEPISNEVPDKFSLSQNYPNPFNPTTNIKFQLPNSGFVKLTVIDMLGREVETLINENLNAGTYNADWNASNYSSGVYLYKIQAGDFSEIKKMVLVK